VRTNPKSDEELVDIWDIGQYQFEVANAEETTSKNGNEMIKLTIKVWDRLGKTRTIFDYLLESPLPAAAKLKAFCKITGLLEKYEAGNITADDCIGKGGILALGIETDDSGKYGPKNKINGYKESLPEGAKTPEKPFDDDIPF
jgi:hypothetical protein